MTHSDWHDALKAQLPKGYFARIRDFLDRVYDEELIYPPRDRVFAALSATGLAEVKVVILGQDPYHGPKQAQGLSFSVPDDLPAPPSLQNILKELAEDIGDRPSHDLTAWTQEGVLLLNACLTVPAHRPNGHAGLIWEPFTDAIIQLINQKTEPVVFILWGGFARKKKRLITNPAHLVLESPHPSPLSAYRGFFGSRPFSRANSFLIQTGQTAIDWLKS